MAATQEAILSAKSGFASFDTRFDDLIRPDSALKKLCTGFVWAEGPVYFVTRDYVLWNDIRNDRMLRWYAAAGLAVFRHPVL